MRRWIDVSDMHDAGICEAIVAEAHVEPASAPFGRAEPAAIHGPTHLREAAEGARPLFPAPGG
ncbi:MAG: hypothetical protein IVW53_03530 [Chloroflexi bacterium]|nr:hypothetical protein [Chloroflexota bacterium]